MHMFVCTHPKFVTLWKKHVRFAGARIYIHPMSLNRYMKSEQVTSVPSVQIPPCRQVTGQNLGRGDGDVSGSAALVALDGEDLVVVRAKGQAGLGPGVKVVLDGDGAADAVVAADGPVLVKGGGALDAGLVDALRLVDVVCVAVSGDRGDLGGCF